MRHAAHKDPSTYPRSYQSKVSTVDGQAAFLGLPKQQEHQEIFRGYSFRRDPNYSPRVPASLTSELHDTEEWRALQQALSRDGEMTRQDRQKLYDERRRLRDKLKDYHRSTRTTRPLEPLELIHESAFQQTRKLMPERNVLASLLFEKGSLRDETGCLVMRQLVALCRQQRYDTVCPNLVESYRECQRCGLTQTR